jgi:AcrR family transcriptional regulator
VPDTRERILEAGIALWRQQPPATLFAGLSVAKVSEAAGITRSTFYSYWPSSSEFLSDLARYLVELDATNYPAIVAATERHPSPPNPSSDVPRTIVSDCARHLDVAILDPTLGIRLGLLSRVDDPEVAEVLRELYRNAESAQFQPLAISLDHWGRKIREPLTEDTLKIVFSSILEGFAARSTVEPDRFPLDLYGQVVLPLLVMLTRRHDDDRNLFEIVDTVNSWTAVGLAEKLREREAFTQQVTSQFGNNSMREITILVRRLLAQVGFGQLSMAELAGVAGSSESGIYQLFGSRSGIALCTLLLNSFERFNEVPDHVRGLQRVRALIQIYTDELLRNPAIVQDLMMLLSGHTAMPRLDLVDFDPRPIFDEAVREAITNGELHAELDPLEFSAMLQRVTLLEASQAASSTTSLDTIELLLRGAGATPRDHDTATSS